MRTSGEELKIYKVSKKQNLNQKKNKIKSSIKNANKIEFLQCGNFDFIAS